MASTTDLTKNGRPSATGKSYTSVQIIEAEVKSLIKQHFSSTLGTINDISNLVLACIYKESTFNPAANSGLHSEGHFNRFKKYPSISAKYAANATTEQEKANMRRSVAGFGLMQATGWYLIKGAGPGGKNELSRMRADLAEPLLVEPGVDINTKLGPDQVRNQLLAGLIILEDKFRVSGSRVANPPTKDKPYTSKVTATFAGFLGRGFDKNGTNPQAYAQSIIQGDAYASATSGFSKPAANKGTLAAGPTQTLASGTNPGTVGCSCG
jgi:hypothetical protein